MSIILILSILLNIIALITSYQDIQTIARLTDKINQAATTNVKLKKQADDFEYLMNEAIRKSELDYEPVKKQLLAITKLNHQILNFVKNRAKTNTFLFVNSLDKNLASIQNLFKDYDEKERLHIDFMYYLVNLRNPTSKDNSWTFHLQGTPAELLSQIDFHLKVGLKQFSSHYINNRHPVGIELTILKPVTFTEPVIIKEIEVVEVPVPAPITIEKTNINKDLEATIALEVDLALDRKMKQRQLA